MEAIGSKVLNRVGLGKTKLYRTSSGTAATSMPTDPALLVAGFREICVICEVND